MKFKFLISSVCIISSLFGNVERSIAQIDTLREYFYNGQMIYCYPRVDGEYNGLSHEWYENGQLKSEGNFEHGLHAGIWMSYYENGQLKMKSWNEGGKIVRYETYHDNGNRESISKPTMRGRIEKAWAIQGQLLVTSKHIHGYPIKCNAPLPKDSVERKNNTQVCYCGNEQVYWNDSIYVDNAGKPVNTRYRTKYTHLYHDGKVKSKMVSNKGHGWRKEWDEEGKLVKDEKF